MPRTNWLMYRPKPSLSQPRLVKMLYSYCRYGGGRLLERHVEALVDLLRPAADPPDAVARHPAAAQGREGLAVGVAQARIARDEVVLRALVGEQVVGEVGRRLLRPADHERQEVVGQVADGGGLLGLVLVDVADDAHAVVAELHRPLHGEPRPRGRAGRRPRRRAPRHGPRRGQESIPALGRLLGRLRHPDDLVPLLDAHVAEQLPARAGGRAPQPSGSRARRADASARSSPRRTRSRRAAPRRRPSRGAVRRARALLDDLGLALLRLLVRALADPLPSPRGRRCTSGTCAPSCARGRRAAPPCTPCPAIRWLSSPWHQPASSSSPAM